MAAFSAVNSGLPALEENQATSAPTPSTPKASSQEAEQPQHDAIVNESSPNTPTRHSFGGILGQKPLPDGESIAPETPQRTEGTSAVKRDASHLEDVEMGEADAAENAEDDGSDDESVDGDGQRSSKKKKGQRFFCTEFPPCQLSFTRSEHLARHIRKHTGERPFQCHCSRRFSRLDNLRQHAQTVHVNEEIPAESLAATSTRFQRQIRTDRVRPPNSRSRASTLGSSAGGGHRGHGRNLSTSSIGSTTSSLGGDDDVRRRPQPLAMAGTDGAARARLSLETYNTMNGPGQQQYVYYNQSPSGQSTPTSIAFSTGGQSPRFQSGVTSPGSTLSRNSYYNGARHSHNRRLSVPSAANPYQTPTMSYHQGPYFSPLPSGTSANFSQNSSVFGSPTSSVFSHGRRESESEMEWRRRTWHPSSNSQYAQRPATSGLTYHQTPDEPRPAFTQHQAASQMTRLPGIESFDHAPPPGVRQQPPPDAMVPDASPRPMSSGRELQQGLTRLDITAANAPVEGHWQAHQGPPPQVQPYYHQGPAHMAQYIQPKHVSMPEPPITPRRNKRNAWYGGPITPGQPVPGQPYLVHRPSPEDSGSSDGVPTPSTLQVNEYHPVIVNPGGPTDYPPPGTAITTDDQQKVYYAPSAHIQHKSDRVRTDSGYQTYQPHEQQQQQPPQTYALQSGHDPRYAQQSYAPQHHHDMSKLDALVAVATSEGSRAAENR